MARLRDFITYYESIGGWKAVHYWWNNEDPEFGGFYEPYQTGVGTYDKPELARAEAIAWAQVEGIQYKEPNDE